MSASPEFKASAGSKTDGRRLRSSNSRKRIVSAMLELVRQGEVAPGAEAVSRQAGIGLRTVFRHFKDLESLYREMAMEIERQIMPALSQPLHSAAWHERLFEFQERKAGTYERIMPFRIAAEVHRFDSPFIAQHIEQWFRTERRLLEWILPFTPEQEPGLFHALEALLSFDLWERLRRTQGQSREQANATVGLMLRGVLQDHYPDTVTRHRR